VLRLPVQASRAFFGKLRLEANVFRRDFRNYGDDDVLQNAGVSLPISSASARIFDEEIKIEVPRWGRFSGFVSYSNQIGMAQGPVTGGLFFGHRRSRRSQPDQPLNVIDRAGLFSSTAISPSRSVTLR